MVMLSTLYAGGSQVQPEIVTRSLTSQTTLSFAIIPQTPCSSDILRLIQLNTLSDARLPR